MRKKLTVTLLAFFTTAFSLVLAQEITVSGKVSDEAGALPGVNIRIKGTNKGAATDFDGNYQITASIGNVLVFSSLGYVTQEITVTGTTHNVTMVEDAGQLDEVVITAFGIKKETKELGYSVTQVKTEDLNLAGQSNGITALQGKVAGLQIRQNSGGAGAGSDISIRGISSLAPGRDNQPLIIVDGIAINNDTFAGSVLPSAGSNSPGSNEQFGFTSRAGDINPDDVESYNILKGAAATALYGVRAANGAIIITTKKGIQGKPKVNFSVNTTFRNVTKTPEQQLKYREGFGGEPRQLYTPETETGFTRVNNGTVFYNWGPKYAADSYTNDDNTIVDLSGDRIYDPMDLFKTGINTQINFNIAGASDKIDYFFSAGNSTDESTVPNSNFDKTTFRFTGGYQVAENFKINTSISYAKSGGKRANGGDKSIISALAYFSNTFPVNDYQNADGSERDYSHGIIDNPRYYAERSSYEDDVNRWIGNITLNYNPLDWMNIVYTAQVDNYADHRDRFVPGDLDSGSQVGGFVVNENVRFVGLESNLLVTMTKDWNDKFTSSLMVGNQVSDRKRNYDRIYGEQLNIPYFNHISNTGIRDNSSSISHLRNTGLYGEIKLGYDNKLFLSMTGRNDWLSTLPTNNRSFFYPSISASYIFSEDFIGDNSILSFGKIRASYAEVGNGPGFAQTDSYILPANGFPFGGVGGYATSISGGNINLVPERSKSIEIGADLRFLKNRLRFDYAYYTTKVTDQIFSTSVPPSTGLSRFVTNAGSYETSGHELMISGDIIKTEDLNWQMIFNFSTNKGKVLDLPDDIDNITYASDGGPEIYSRVKEGDKMGTIYGYKWRRENNGERYIDANGYPTIDRSEGYVIVGNAFPDFVSSIGNHLRWKNIGFNFLLEWSKGGDKYSWARRQMLRNGTSKATELRIRTADYVFSGVMEDPANPGTYIPNTTPAAFGLDEDYYRSWSRYTGAAEAILQDASWIKLRSIGLSYDFSSHLTKWNINSFVLNASANNIILWTPYDGYDPEGSTYSAGSGVYGFSGKGIPLTENYSIGLQIGF
ncbi:SusC/RagA family TonB-linked outer membrane protein [Flavobacteriaceae bacterium F08102]|nr:SusC/RagA family TonB-linked outer membrane protein [Flavobacteriaceae bacterium F08102]